MDDPADRGPGGELRALGLVCAEGRRHLPGRRPLRRHHRRRRRAVRRRHPPAVASSAAGRRRAPTLLSAVRRRDNAVFTSTGQPRPAAGRQARRAARSTSSGAGCCGAERLYERVALHQLRHVDVMLPLAFEFAADFGDMFEVRGVDRPARGTALSRRSSTDGARAVRLRGPGRDRADDHVSLFRAAGAAGRATRRRFMFTLVAGERTPTCSSRPAPGERPAVRERFRRAAGSARRSDAPATAARRAAALVGAGYSTPGSSSRAPIWRC